LLVVAVAAWKILLLVIAVAGFTSNSIIAASPAQATIAGHCYC